MHSRLGPHWHTLPPAWATSTAVCSWACSSAQPTCSACFTGKTTESRGSSHDSNCSVDTALSSCQPGFYPAHGGALQERTQQRSKALLGRMQNSKCSSNLTTPTFLTCSNECLPCPPGAAIRITLDCHQEMCVMQPSLRSAACANHCCYMVDALVQDTT